MNGDVVMSNSGMGARSLEALADRLGFPGENTILSVMRLAASGPPTGSGPYLPQQREKPLPVLLVHEDRVALVPAGGEVPDGARNLRPEGSAHPAAISQCRDLTP